MERAGLKKVNVEYLWAGLELLDDLFDERGDTLILPRGERLTADRLQRLSRFNRGERYITTFQNTFDRIMEHGNVPVEVRRKFVEEKYGYTTLKNNVEGVLRLSRSSDTIQDTALVDPAVDDVFSRLGGLDVNVIFKCIDTPRPIDEDLQRHCLNVALLNGMMGAWLELPPGQVRLLVMAGILHDIGKTHIPEEIINAPRSLTDEEFALIKQHPVYSYELLGRRFDPLVREAARYHHERAGGRGYPDGLDGEDIPIFARITAVTDVYDAMVSKRSYKEERTPFDILDMFYADGFAGLDSELVTVFLYHMKEQLTERGVVMSDGTLGVVRYIPPNDFGHPIIQAGETVRQADENWYAVRIV